MLQPRQRFLTCRLFNKDLHAAVSPDQSIAGSAEGSAAASSSSTHDKRLPPDGGYRVRIGVLVCLRPGAPHGRPRIGGHQDNVTAAVGVIIVRFPFTQCASAGSDLC
eukprot:1484842-Amphidinium_carterae.5